MASCYDRKTMMLFLIFTMGVANFAMHKAVMESDHPVVMQTRQSIGRLMGPYGTYFLEFVILVAALAFASLDVSPIILFYAAYTAANGLGAWFLLRNRR